MSIPLSGPANAETKEDPLGTVTIKKGEPIVVGAYLAVDGPNAALGVDEKRGIEIAFDKVDWKIAGHPIKLLVEDSACTSEGGQTAAVKLASNEKVLLVIGPSCSNAAMPGAPILWKTGIASIGLNSVAKITAPDRAPEYDGYLRTSFNDAWSAVSDAKYAYEYAKHRKAVLLHDGTAYSQSVAEGFGDAFKKLGGTVLSTEAIGAQDVDMRPALERIATMHPDLIYMPVYLPAAGYLVRQAHDVKGLKGVELLGQNSLMTPDMITAAGGDVVGFHIALVDLSNDAFSKSYPTFLETYREKYGESPPQAYHYLAYDAGLLATAALQDLMKPDADGTIRIGRQALRDRLFATKGLQGLSGTLTCDQNGDCGVYHGAVYEFTDSDPSTFEVGTNPKKIWPVDK